MTYKADSISPLPLACARSFVPQANDVIIFGGTFDPIHSGHISAIKNALEYFSRLIIAPTTQNPWKTDKATNFALRVSMIEQVLAYENIPLTKELAGLGVSISNISYIYSEELAATIKPTIQGRLFWLVGEDSKDSVKQWRNWDIHGVPTLFAPVVIDTHSELARNGQTALHPAITDFATQRDLYTKPKDV